MNNEVFFSALGSAGVGVVAGGINGLRSYRRVMSKPGSDTTHKLMYDRGTTLMLQGSSANSNDSRASNPYTTQLGLIDNQLKIIFTSDPVEKASAARAYALTTAAETFLVTAGLAFAAAEVVQYGNELIQNSGILKAAFSQIAGSVLS